MSLIDIFNTQDSSIFDEPPVKPGKPGIVANKNGAAAAIIVAANTGDNLFNLADQASKDLQLNGESPIYDKALAIGKNRDQQEFNLSMQEGIDELANIKKDPKAQDYARILDEALSGINVSFKNSRNIRDMAFEIASEAVDSKATAVENDVQSERIRLFPRNLRDSMSTSDIQEYAKLKFPVTETNLAKDLTSFTASALIPGNYTIAVMHAIKGAYPEIELSTPGSMLEQFKVRLRNDPDPKAAVDRLMEAVSIGGNLSPNFPKYDVLTSVLGDLDYSDEQIDKEAFFQNVISTLDVIPILGYGAKSLLKLGSKAANIQRLNKANPRLAKQVIEQVLNEPQAYKRAEDLLEEPIPHLVYEGGLPKPVTNERLPDLPSLGDDYNISDRNVLNADFTISTLTQDEKKILENKLRDTIKYGVGEMETTHQLHLTTVEPTGFGYRVNAVIGSTATSPFSSLKQAIHAVKKFRLPDNYQVTFKRLNLETGEYEPVSQSYFNKIDATKKFTKREPYIAEINYDHYIRPDDYIPGTLDETVKTVLGKAGKFSDKTAFIPEWILNAENTLGNLSEAVRVQLRKMREPLYVLNNRDKKSVLDILAKQEKNSAWYSKEELNQLYNGNKKLVDATLAVRKHTDAMWVVENRRLYRKLVSEGLSTIDFKIAGKEENKAIGKVLNPQSLPRRMRVYDLRNDAVNVLSKEEATKLLTDKQIIELRTPFRNKDTLVRYIIGDGTDINISNIPSTVLNYIPGYIPRVYDANYIVAKASKATDLDGNIVDVRIPVALTKYIDEAASDLELRQANSPNNKFVIVKTREATDDELQYAQRQSLFNLQETGRLFTSKRGEKLDRLAEGGIDGRRDLLDIEDSLEAGEAKIANTVGIDKIIESLTVRWEAEYPEFRTLDPITRKPRMPMSGNLNDSGLVATEGVSPKLMKERMAKAIQMRDHISLIAGVDNTAARRVWRNFALSMGESALLRTPESKLGKFLTDTKDIVPYIDIPKRAGFLNYIVANPLRQVMLQAQQASLYINAPGGLKYMTSLQGAKDTYSILMGWAFKDAKDYGDMLKYIGKNIKQSPEEIDRLVKAFEKSGFWQSVDSHQYAISMSNSLPGILSKNDLFFKSNTSNTIVKNMKAIATFSRRIGFDIGERVHIVPAFLVERNRWILENPKLADLWDRPDNLATIVGRARTRSLDLSRTGQTEWNRGLWGAMFQFMSHNLKMIQLMLPGKLGNKTISNKEKFAIFLAQSIIYGTGGWGATQLVNKIAEGVSSITKEPVEIPEEARLLIREGIVGSTINVAARMANGEDPFTGPTNILISSNIAPGSGLTGAIPNVTSQDAIPLTKIWEALYRNDINLVEFMTGPGGQSLGGIADRSKLALAFAGIGIGPRFDTKKTPLAIVDELARIIPAYNNYMKGRAAIVASRFLTDTGKLSVEATAAEARFKQAFGFRSAKEAEVSQTLLDMEGVSQALIEPSDGDLASTARTMYNRTLAFARKFEAGQISEIEFFNMINDEHVALKWTLDDVEYNAVRNRILDIALAELNKDKESQLLDLMWKGLQSGKVRPTSQVITELKNQTPWKGRDALIQVMEDMARNFGENPNG